jgi:hypothetical protein
MKKAEQALRMMKVTTPWPPDLTPSSKRPKLEPLPGSYAAAKTARKPLISQAPADKRR